MIKEWLERMDRRMDRIESRIDDIHTVAQAQHATLEDHTRRSLANEIAVELLTAKLTPFQEAVVTIRNVGRLLLLVGALSGAVAAVLHLTGVLR